MRSRWFELEQEIIGAVRRWLDTTRDDWLLAVGVDDGSLTAAAIGDAWLGEVRTTVGPAVGSQYIAHLAEHAPRWSGGPVMLNWPEGVEGPATVEELLARYPDTFAGIDPAQVEWVLARPDWQPSFQRFMTEATNLVVGMPDTAFTEVQRALTKLSNTSKFEQQRAVRSFLSWEEEGGYRGWMRRAERIARTELHTARSAAMDKAAGWLADTGATVRKVWISAADERVRPEHVAANGQTVGYDEPFIVGGEQLWYPGDRENGSAGNTIQCVVGSTRVSGPGQDVLVAYRRPVTGRFVKLTVGDGRVLTCTPNHPILTPAGYVPAKDLGEGNYVMATVPSGVPEVDNIPPRIDEAFDAVRGLGSTRRVGGVGLDFHGDGSEEEEVEVVTSNGELRDRFNAAFGAGFGEEGLVGLNHAKGSGSAAGGGLARGDAVAGVAGGGSSGSTPGAGSVVGGSGEGSPFGGGEPGHSDGVGLAATSDRESEFGEVAGDDVSGDSEDARHLQHAGSLGVEPTKIVGVELYFGVHDVFNLETTENYFFANGIAVHNCRCVVNYIDEGVGTVREREVENFEELQDMLEQMKKTEQEEQDRARGLTAAGAVEGVEWEGVLAPVGEPSGDGRILAADGQYRFREFPLPLMWQESTLDGHDSARVVGSITEGEVEDGRITARGIVFASEEKVLELLEAGVIRPSVDLCDMVASLDEDTDELVVEAATVMAATLVAKPAFENVHVTVGDTRMVPEELVAAAAVDLGAYESHWFADPSLEGPTPVTVTEDGRVFGHLALWDSHHVGMPGRRVNPPRSRSGYASFHQSTVVTERGRVAVGRLTVGGGHASARAGVRAAAEHYDETGTCWAFVRAGEDEHGIWVAGEVNHDADPVKVREGAQAPLSGDWRRVGAGLELVAALSVSTPGFPVRRESTNSMGEEYALVAAAAVEPVVSVEDVARAAVDRVWEKREAEEAARSRFKAMEDVSGVFTRVQRHLALEGLQGRFNRAWKGVED